MQLTLYSDSADVRSAQILSVGSLCGVPITAKEIKEGEKISCQSANNDSCLGCMYPILDTHDGYVVAGSVAIMKYVAKINPSKEMNGSTFANKIRVDSILDTYFYKLENAYLACVAKNKNVDSAEKELKKLYSSLNDYLLTHTYLAGENMTIADVAVCTLVSIISKEGTIKIDACQLFPSLARLVDTVVNQPGVNELLSAVSKPKGTKSSRATQAADHAEKPKEDKAPASKPEEDEETLAAKELDAIASVSPFILDAWKREYSNSLDVRNQAMKYFWENYDRNGWCMYFFKYVKLPDECTISFTTSNQLNGFLQRMHPHIRRHSFGVWVILGESKCFDIKGLMMFRSSNMPRLMTMHPSYEFHETRKLDVDNEDDKKLITEYFCAGGKNSDVKELDGSPIFEVVVWK